MAVVHRQQCWAPVVSAFVLVIMQPSLIAAENMLDLPSQHPILLLLPRESIAFPFYIRGLNTY